MAEHALTQIVEDRCADFRIEIVTAKSDTANHYDSAREQPEDAPEYLQIPGNQCLIDKKFEAQGNAGIKADFNSPSPDLRQTERLKGRLGPAQALVATAHKIARIV